MIEECKVPEKICGKCHWFSDDGDNLPVYIDPSDGCPMPGYDIAECFLNPPVVFHYREKPSSFVDVKESEYIHIRPEVNYFHYCSHFRAKGTPE